MTLEVPEKPAPAFSGASFSHPQTNVAELRDGEIHVVSSEAGCRSLQFELFGKHVWEERFRHGCETAVRDGGADLLHVAVSTMPKATFIFLPLIALLHMFMYWRPRHPYAEHLLFFIHLHAFSFSVMTLAILLGYVADAWPSVEEDSHYLSSIRSYWA